MKYFAKPVVIKAAGKPPKQIGEFIGRVNSKMTEVSIARMTSPAGWSEPGQTPAFNEYTVVLKGYAQGEAEGKRTGRVGRPGNHHTGRRMGPDADKASDLPHNIKLLALCYIKQHGVEAWKKKAAEVKQRYFPGKTEIGKGPQMN